MRCTRGWYSTELNTRRNHHSWEKAEIYGLRRTIIWKVFAPSAEQDAGHDGVLAATSWSSDWNPTMASLWICRRGVESEKIHRVNQTSEFLWIGAKTGRGVVVLSQIQMKVELNSATSSKYSLYHVTHESPFGYLIPAKLKLSTDALYRNSL